MIAEGRIALNGEKITTPATLLEDVAGLTLDGRPVRPAKATRLYRFYKPPGTLTAERDPRGRATIYDRLPPGLRSRRAIYDVFFGLKGESGRFHPTGEIFCA